MTEIEIIASVFTSILASISAGAFVFCIFAAYLCCLKKKIVVIHSCNDISDVNGNRNAITINIHNKTCYNIEVLSIKGISEVDHNCFFKVWSNEKLSVTPSEKQMIELKITQTGSYNNSFGQTHPSFSDFSYVLEKCKPIEIKINVFTEFGSFILNVESCDLDLNL
jgi:hypothetical protein